MKKSLRDVAQTIAVDVYEAGGIDAQTMHEFDAKCLPPVKSYNARQIKSIRLRNKVSQPVFAKYLNTSASTVRQWEQGLKRPSGIALKLLSLIDHHGLRYVAV